MASARRSVVVGNWKMQLSHKAALETARAVHKLLRGVKISSTDAVLCPSFPSLAGVADVFKKRSAVAVGAQTVHWEERGAWTGEVALAQISPFVTWCIVGHSEQRRLTGEREEQVAARAARLIRHGITPVVCIGESAQERAAEQSVARISEQMRVLLGAMTRAALPKLVVAYEPIWAVSSNAPDELPDPAEVVSMVVLIRKLTAGRFGVEAAERMRVIYGGSVTAGNVLSYVAEPGVDGVLPGSASLQPRQFVEMVKKVDEVAGGS